MGDPERAALISGTFAVAVVLISEWLHRRDARQRGRKARTRRPFLPDWEPTAIVGVALVIVLAQAFAPLLTDRRIDVPPLLYFLAAGAVGYRLTLRLARRDDDDDAE